MWKFSGFIHKYDSIADDYFFEEKNLQSYL
jgi:hypothetical protein